jgi:hypothetical protein
VYIKFIRLELLSFFYLGYAETLGSPGFSLDGLPLYQFYKAVEAFRAFDAWCDIFHFESMFTVETSVGPHSRTPPVISCGIQVFFIIANKAACW